MDGEAPMLWWLAEAEAFEAGQVYLGVEVSGAIGPKPSKAQRRDPDFGGGGLGLIAGFELAAHDGFGPIGGGFVHGRIGRGWNGVTLGTNAGFGATAAGCSGGFMTEGSATGELGVAFVRGMDPALHVGLRAYSLAFDLRGSAHLRHGEPAHDGTIAVGLLAPILSPGYCVDGRPCRVDDRLVTGRAAGGDGDVDDVAGELGSVPAFLRLAAELRALGADPDLVRRARRAAAEELVHARLCAIAAVRRSGKPVVAAAAWAPPRRFPSRDAGLSTIAVESLLDGVIGEAEAADRAEATDLPHKARIVVEERGHARLAEDVVRWAVREGGRPVSRAVQGAV